MSHQWQYIDPKTGSKLVFSNESQAWVPADSTASDQSAKTEAVTSSCDLQASLPGDVDRSKFMKYDEKKQRWIFCDPKSNQKLTWDEATEAWQEVSDTDSGTKEEEVKRIQELM